MVDTLDSPWMRVITTQKINLDLFFLDDEGVRIPRMLQVQELGFLRSCFINFLQDDDVVFVLQMPWRLEDILDDLMPLIIF